MVNFELEIYLTDFLNRTFAGENAKNRELCGRKNKNPAPFTMPALTVVRRFCNGPLVVNPFFAPSTAGVMLLSGVSAQAAALWC
ncbi:MAG: hypothetical protein ACLP7P_08715 [Rhodomicrobium sp.]